MLKGGAIWALGTMSGTSLDGVDAAMLLTDGERILDFGPTAFRPYSAAEQATIRAALGRWPGEDGVEAAAEVVETAHAELLSRFTGAGIIGFHGQTLAHEPKGRGTHQAGNGALLAGALNLPVVWDFRSADVAMGGQGAPLAPFFHFACARHIGATQPLAMLNLGGVGNVTWIDPRHAAPESHGALLAFDTGPANAPLNDLMLARTGQPLDPGGETGLRGHVDEDRLQAFLAHPFFHRMPPKSLDRNDFHATLDMGNLGTEDAAATLAAAAAAAVARGGSISPSPLPASSSPGAGGTMPASWRNSRRGCGSRLNRSKPQA